MSSGGFSAAALRQISADAVQKAMQEKERDFRILCDSIQEKLQNAAKQQLTQLELGPMIAINGSHGYSPYSERFTDRAVDWLKNAGFTVTPSMKPGSYLISW